MVHILLNTVCSIRKSQFNSKFKDHIEKFSSIWTNYGPWATAGHVAHRVIYVLIQPICYIYFIQIIHI